MKTRVLLFAAALLLVSITASQAGGRCGPGWGGGPRFYGGWGWGGGYCGPAFGVAFAAPVVVYRPAPVYYYAAPVYVASQASLVRAQAQLSRLGYYRGEVDGSFGPLTSSALRRYQADYGLPITGRLDRATLDTLGA
ncbi:MAG TPA: peptidoglycan-binding domain-containing protein [Chthoniobacterales bacterium]|jgi:hypothetical protein